MADFAVPVTTILSKEPIEGTKSLELVRVLGGYGVITKVDEYQVGDLVAYIPVGASLPEAAIRRMGIIRSRLAGNRVVKPFPILSAVSEGFVYKAEEGWVEGDDVADVLELDKFVVPDLVSNVGRRKVEETYCFNFDFNSAKSLKEPLFYPGEKIQVSEKLHGSAGVYVLQPDGGFLIGTKKLMAKGQYYTLADSTVHVQCAMDLDIFGKMSRVFAKATEPVFLLGEVLGVQDLSYGYSNTSTGYRVFDVYLGWPLNGRYVNDDELDSLCQSLGLERVPVLYRGPYNEEIIKSLVSGTETLTGKETHMREGVVVKACQERMQKGMPGNRAACKVVSEAYLVRKDGTEYT